MAEVKKVVLYVRVEKFENNISEEKLNADLRILKDYCKRMGYKVSKEFKECYPDVATASPEWYRMKKYIENQYGDIKHVLIPKWDLVGKTYQEFVLAIASLTKLKCELNTPSSPVVYPA